MKYCYSFFVLSLFWQCYGNAQISYQNVMIGDKKSPNEPAICLDPKHPERIVASSNIANMYYSQDTGATWTSSIQKSEYGVWGDPAIVVDTNGYFYHFHLSNPTEGSWIDRIVCQKSTDGGKTWEGGTYTGLNGDKDQDKHWPIVDPATNNIYVTWTQFDKYNSKSAADDSNILFSASKDGGETWSVPKMINQVPGDCLDDDNTVEGAVPAVGPNGEIYVSWAGPEGIVFDVSKDMGRTWKKKDIHVGDFPGGWNMDIPGIMRSNGMPVTVCDLSKGPNRGTIYINWADQRNGEADTDIWTCFSKNGGKSWSAPVRVNDDAPGKQQFLPWMAIDQATGYLYVVFYDRRDYEDEKTDVYLAVSKDGGKSFQNIKISNEPFLPVKRTFFGDYNNITVYNGIVRPIWTRMDNGKTSIWTALINM